MSGGGDGVNPELVKLLVCPETHQPLRLAREDELAALNAKLRAGKLQNRNGETPTTELAEALVREDGHRVYPVEDGIPVMLIEEALEV